jgi:transposase
VLGEVAWAARRPGGASFGARFRRRARRLGKPPALVAVMHNGLTVVDHVLRDRAPYAELGPDPFARQDPQRAARRHVAQLERLGSRVALTPAA